MKEGYRMIKQWKELFKAHILERGLNYYEMGAVNSLKRTDRGYTAEVEGSEEYQVEIELEDEYISDMTCDCPYAYDGNNCKHMAAVLYEIENGKADTTFNKDLSNEIRAKKQELKETIDIIPIEDLKNMLLEISYEDVNLQNIILTKYAPITPRQMVRLKKQVDDIGYKYSGRDGFVDYYHASEYIDEIYKMLNDNVSLLIERGYRIEAFELVNCVFYEVGNRDIDDSDGGTEIIARECYEYWKNILEVCNEQEKNELFRWFEEHKENYVIDYMQDYINDFLMYEFNDEELLLEKMRMLDEIISKKIDDNNAGYLYSSYYGMVSTIMERIKIMEQLNYSQKDILEYRNQYRKFYEIRQLEIKEYIKKHDYDNAISVLKESKEIDKDRIKLVTEYSEQLIRIYKKLDNQDDYKEELIFYVFNCENYDISYVMELKKVCNNDEWNNYREQFLNSDNSYVLKLELLNKERLYDRLFEEIKEKNSIYTLDKYERNLKKYLPEEVRDVYINYVNEEMCNACSRNRYKDLIKYLKKISRYPEGQRLAQEISDLWKREYKKRSAMIDELNRAGF